MRTALPTDQPTPKPPDPRRPETLLPTNSPPLPAGDPRGTRLTTHQPNPARGHGEPLHHSGRIQQIFPCAADSQR